MRRGRPPKPGTAEEKADARRERVRNNVRALRERRKKEVNSVQNATGFDGFQIQWIDDYDYDNTKVPLADSDDRPTTVTDAPSCRDLVKIDQGPVSIRGRSRAMFLARRGKEASLIFPSHVDAKSPYAMALLATVRNQFLPDAVYLPPATDSTKGSPWESPQFLWTPCAFWVTSAFTKASGQDASALKTCLLAIGMLLKGLEFQDTSLKVASLEMYRRALQGIRRSLQPLIEGRASKPKDTASLYLSCHAAAMFELVQNADLSATMHHLRGVSQLICHLCDGGDDEGQSLAWLLLQDSRLVEMGLCLKFRYMSFFSKQRSHFEKSVIGRIGTRKRAVSAHGYTSHNMLVTLTDMADDISAIMVQLDIIRSHLNQSDDPTRIYHLQENLDRIWGCYGYLHDQLISRYGSAFVYNEAVGGDSDMRSCEFKTFDIGAAWCYNLMTQVYCLETQIDATTLLLQTKGGFGSEASARRSSHSQQSDDRNTNTTDEAVSFEKIHQLRALQRSTCIDLTQCTQYFLQTDKGITGQTIAMFPLDAAFCHLNLELQRLDLDLQLAGNVQQSDQRLAHTKTHIVELKKAMIFCRSMQERAKTFGLPTFHNAAKADFVEPAESAKDDARWTSYIG